MYAYSFIYFIDTPSPTRHNNIHVSSFVSWHAVYLNEINCNNMIWDDPGRFKGWFLVALGGLLVLVLLGCCTLNIYRKTSKLQKHRLGKVNKSTRDSGCDYYCRDPS